MADLEYTVKVSGVEDVERLEKNLDNLHRTLNAGSGAGKSLEEMRKILVGMRGQSSIIADLRDSVKSLNTAAENLGKGFESGFSKLDKTLKQGFQLTLDRLNMVSAEMREGLASGVKGAFDAGAKAASGGGAKLAKGFAAANAELEGEIKNAAAHARKVATAAYTELVGGDGMLGIDKAMAGEIARLRSAGATISKYHADILKGYEKTFNYIRDKDAELAKLRDKSAPRKHSEDEVRLLLGMPTRSEMASASNSLKADIIARRTELESAVRASV